MPISDDEVRARIEAALYSAGRPLGLEDLAKAAGITSKARALKAARSIAKMVNRYMHALEAVELPGQKFALQLKPRYNRVARRFSIRPLVPRSVLKTLSYIVYFQPVTGSELLSSRGARVYSHLKTLRELGFIECEQSGRSRVYRTTPKFSEYFGLSTEPEQIRRQLSSALAKISVSEKV